MEHLLELALLNGLLAAVLAVLVGLVTCLIRRPALAHVLWLLVLIKLITPPVLAIEVPWPAPMLAEEQALAQALPCAPPAPVAELPQAAPDPPKAVAGANRHPADEAVPPAAVSPEPEQTGRATNLPENAPAEALPVPSATWFTTWHVPVAVLWLGGTCLWWVLAAWRLAGFRRLLRAALPASPFVQARAEALARTLGLSSCPPVRFLPGSLPPLLWAFLGKPCVYLPDRLWGELTYRQQETLLAHELAHLRRHDHWVRRLELMVLGLYWWHPAAWWARRGIHQAEELLCDARVVHTLPGAADAYAQALIQTVSFLSGPRPMLPAAASGMGQVRPLKARVTMIMRGTNADRLPRPGAWSLAVVGLALLLLRPAWAPSPTNAAAADETPAPVAVQAAPQTDNVPKPGPHEIRVFTPATPAGVKGLRVLAQAEGSKTTGGQAGFVVIGKQSPELEQEVQLLQAQLAARNAELQEARVLFRLAKKTYDRVQTLFNTSGASQELLDKAQADMEIQQARMQGKEAQTREAQLRLEAAQRRVGQPGEVNRIRTFGQASRRVGGGPGGGGGPAGGGFGGGGARTPSEPPVGGAAPAVPRAIEQAPGAMPTPRFAPGGSTPGPGGPGSISRPGGRSVIAPEDRLQMMERRLDALLQEIQALRAELAAQRRQVGVPARRQGPAPETPDPTRPELTRPPERQ